MPAEGAPSAAEHGALLQEGSANPISQAESLMDPAESCNLLMVSGGSGRLSMSDLRAGSSTCSKELPQFVMHDRRPRVSLSQLKRSSLALTCML